MNSKTSKLIRKFAIRSVPAEVENPARIRRLLMRTLKKTWNRMNRAERTAFRKRLQSRVKKVVA